MTFYLIILIVGAMYSPLRGDGDMVRQFIFGGDTCILHTRTLADIGYRYNRITVKGDIKVFKSQDDVLREICTGWMQKGTLYDYNDLACLSLHWKGHTQTSTPDEPEKKVVTLDPSVISAIFAAIQGGQDPNVCVTMLRLAMERNDLLQTVTVSTYDKQYYHRPSCPVINAARFAVVWNTEITLLNALLDGRKRCEKCKPVEVAP